HGGRVRVAGGHPGLAAERPVRPPGPGMTVRPPSRIWQRVAFLAAFVILAVLPAGLELSAHTHNQLTFLLTTSAGALAWNWMGGFVGQVSFGHAAMFGVGGFVAAQLMLRLHLPAPLSWVGGAVVAGGFALGAHPLLRLRGPYFSIAT